MKKIPVSPLNWSKDDAMAEHLCETSDQASLTTPDQALSLKELITRHTRGIPVPTFKPVYDGENDFPDFSRMNPMEIQDFQRDLSEYIKETGITLNSKLNENDDDIIELPPSETDETTPPKKKGA